jgi:hypothetical protein
LLAQYPPNRPCLADAVAPARRTFAFDGDAHRRESVIGSKPLKTAAGFVESVGRSGGI